MPCEKSREDLGAALDRLEQATKPDALKRLRNEVVVGRPLHPRHIVIACVEVLEEAADNQLNDRGTCLNEAARLRSVLEEKPR